MTTNTIAEKTRLQSVMRRLSVYQLILALCGVFSFVIGNELLWVRVQKSGMSKALQQGFPLSQNFPLVASPEMCSTVAEAGIRAFAPILFFQVFLTLTTIALVVLVIAYWRARYAVGVFDGKYIPEAFMKSSAFKYMLLDIFVCGFHCPPYIGGCLPETLLLSGKYTSHYHKQLLSMAVLVFRWHLVLRFLRYNNLFTRHSSNTFTTMFNINVSEV